MLILAPLSWMLPLPIDTIGFFECLSIGADSRLQIIKGTSVNENAAELLREAMRVTRSKAALDRRNPR